VRVPAETKTWYKAMPSQHHEYYVYILCCADQSYYTGVTNDLQKRLWQHETGYFATCYTYSRRPVVLVYAERYLHIDQAKAREAQIKGWSRKKKQALKAEDWEALKTLARSKSTNP
jgi:putative endonuclease